MNSNSKFYRKVYLFFFLGIAFFKFTSICSAQGFSNTYTPNGNDRFTKMAYHEGRDHFMTMGVGYIDSLERIGVYATLIDTNGHLIKTQVIPNDSNYITTTDDKNTCIPTDDGGYLMLYSLFSISSSEVTKLDSALNIEWQYDFTAIGLTSFIQHIYERDSSYLFYGRYQTLEFDSDLYIAELTKTGMFIRDDSVGTENNEFSSFLYGDNNRILMASIFYLTDSWVSPWDLEPGEVLLRKNIIHKFDEEVGFTLLHEGEINPTFGLLSTNMIQHDSGYFAVCREQEPDFTYNVWKRNFGIVRLDKNFDWEWYKFYDEFDLKFKGPSNLLLTKNKHLILTGHIGGRGIVVKLDLDGHIIWEIRPNLEDILGLQDSSFSRDRVIDLVELPSGNFIATGTNEPIFQNTPSSGWLLKITPDGCYETMCITTNTFEEQKAEKSILVYPNPSSGQFTIKSTEGPSWQGAHLQVFGPSGAQISSTILNRNSFTIASPGIHFVRIYREGQLLLSERVVVLE